MQTIIVRTLKAVAVHVDLINTVRAIFWETSLGAPLAYEIVELSHLVTSCCPEPTFVLSRRDAFVWWLRYGDLFGSVQHTLCPIALLWTTH